MVRSWLPWRHDLERRALRRERHDGGPQNAAAAFIKVNDRGPFAHDRILDLSKGAAIKLGVIRTGTAKVRVQFLEKETHDYVENEQRSVEYAMNQINNVNPQEAGDREEAGTRPSFQVQARLYPDDRAAGLKTTQEVQLPPPVNVNHPEQTLPQTPGVEPDEFSVVDKQGNLTTLPPEPVRLAPVGHTPQYGTLRVPVKANFFIQAGTFGVRDNALKLIDRLSDTGTPQIMEVLLNGKKLYRVMVGPYDRQEDAKNVLSKLASIGISDARIIRN